MVTLWPLSADNLSRPPTELKGLIAVITEVLAELAAARQWRIHLIGQVDRLPSEAIRAIRSAENLTASIHGYTVNIALAYDGRAEITAAVRSILRERAAQSVGVTEITEAEIAARLSTHGQPDPDLIIRTSGEQRLSGFLPWQSVYSEIYFSPKYWPDFRKSDFDRAVKWYRTRCRRFGQ
jgi:short-chain Z-isoprenyl diphosphate synthase